MALLRTLLSQPRALLLDEPFSKLDVTLRARFRRFVFDHAVAQGLATLMVTHDPADAQAAGGRVIDVAAAVLAEGRDTAACDAETAAAELETTGVRVAG